MSGSDLVQSVVRGLEILERVTHAERGLTLAQLASALGVQRPTAFNLARTLVAKGYLEKTSRPVRYLPGPAITALYQAQQSHGWRGRVESILLALASSLGDTFLFIAEPLGGELAVTYRVDPSHPDRVERPVGRTLLPYTMALTLCFQAFWPAAERERYESRYPFSDYGRGVWANASTLDSFLAMSREKGYVERRTSGLYRIAAPVYGYEGQLIAALAASCDLAGAESDPDRKAQMIKGVQSAAQDLGLR